MHRNGKPLPGTSTEAARLRAQWREEALGAMEAEHGFLNAEQVEAAAGPDATADLLAVQRGGVPMYPAFQLDADGRPLPLWKELRAIGAKHGLGEEGVLLWMTASITSWGEGGGRPVDHLDDAASVVRAFEAHCNAEW